MLEKIECSNLARINESGVSYVIMWGCSEVLVSEILARYVGHIRYHTKVWERFTSLIEENVKIDKYLFYNLVT